MTDFINVKYLICQKYERKDSIHKKTTIIIEEIEKNSILFVVNILKIQYVKIIICPAGIYK